MHNLPQSWFDRISADPTGFERWLAERSMAKKKKKKKKKKKNTHQKQRWSGWKKEQPHQPLPDEYTSSEQHEKKNKTTLIVGGIVLGLTALIIYEIY